MENSKRLLNDASEKNGISPVQLRDVREIPCVKDNPDIFTSRIPIYFRVDLLKLIILLHSIENDHCDAAVFSDLEVGNRRELDTRMSKQELFDSCVCEGFKKMGFVLGDKRAFANDNHTYPENQFLQLHNNPLTLDAIRFNINSNMDRVIRCLADPNEDVREKIYKLNEKVYLTMFKEIGGFFIAMQEAKIRVPQHSESHAHADDDDEKYYLKGQDKPIETIYAFIPRRNMFNEVRPGRGHVDSMKLTQVAPCNRKEYTCKFLPYQTDEARVVLGLSERGFSVSQLGVFGKPKGSAESSLDQLTQELKDHKNKKVKEIDPVNIDRYLVEKLKNHLDDELAKPTYSAMFTSDPNTGDDLKKYFESASSLISAPIHRM